MTMKSKLMTFKLRKWHFIIEFIFRWAHTSWLLEVIEKIIVDKNTKAKHLGAEWLELVRPMFVLLRKVTQMEQEEIAYKMTLLLTLIKLLLTSVSDKDIKTVEQGQVRHSKIS